MGPLDLNNEIGIITFAFDEFGPANSDPTVYFNQTVIPKVRSWTEYQFGFEGRLVYGPKNPGEFLCYSIIYIEFDQHSQELGTQLEAIVNNGQVKDTVKTLTATHPTAMLVGQVFITLANIIATLLKTNKNDMAACFQGTLFRDSLTGQPYSIGDSRTDENGHIRNTMKIVPLSKYNKNLEKNIGEESLTSQTLREWKLKEW